MGIQVKVPAVGESVTEVTIASWAKKDGDVVQMDEVIAELESDKATFELTAPESGVLKILRKEGESVPVGELVCEIEPNGVPQNKPPAPAAEAKVNEKAPEQGPKDKGSPADPKKSTATGAVKEMRVPEVGESVTEVTISSWLKKDGDFVQLDEIIAEVESDKATFEYPPHCCQRKRNPPRWRIDLQDRSRRRYDGKESHAERALRRRSTEGRTLCRRPSISLSREDT
jgi:2-oxoglutarate dehydrogenase E2 component (dihydrolipoamide succinyltransferase)